MSNKLLAILMSIRIIADFLGMLNKNIFSPIGNWYKNKKIKKLEKKFLVENNKIVKLKSKISIEKNKPESAKSNANLKKMMHELHNLEKGRGDGKND